MTGTNEKRRLATVVRDAAYDDSGFTLAERTGYSADASESFPSRYQNRALWRDKFLYETDLLYAVEAASQLLFVIFSDAELCTKWAPTVHHALQVIPRPDDLR